MEVEECIICFYDKPIEDYICFSCGHKVCATCYPLMRNTCPICRFKETELIQVQIVIPSPTRITRPNYGKIIMNVICLLFCIAVVYLVVLITAQYAI